jgi:hypothetical protein
MQLEINWLTGMLAGTILGLIIAPPRPGLTGAMESAVIVPSFAIGGALLGGFINWL